MFLIKRLWIDPLENRDAFGFEPVGFVVSGDEATRITQLEFVSKTQYPWPLNHAHNFKGDSVPRFIAEEVRAVDGLNLEQLRGLENAMTESAEHRGVFLYAMTTTG